MSGKIFISYRRDDCQWSAGRLFDRLTLDFDPGQIFMDVDNIPPGVDFAKEIERQVASCDVLLALIGRLWISSTDDQGNRRLDNPDDFVRIEIGTALRRNIRVIPVLVDHTVMPKPGQLPDRLKPLVRRQALEVSHNSFKADSDRLIRALKIAVEEAAREGKKRPIEAGGQGKAKRQEKERLEAERREKERLEAGRQEKERLEAGRQEKERLEAGRQEKERLEAERQEKERLEAERREKERHKTEGRQRWLEVQRKEREDRERFVAIRCEENDPLARYGHLKGTLETSEDPTLRNLTSSLNGTSKAPARNLGSLEGVFGSLLEDPPPRNLASPKDISKPSEGSLEGVFGALLEDQTPKSLASPKDISKPSEEAPPINLALLEPFSRSRL